MDGKAIAGLWALVPVKPFGEAKLRLSAALGDAEWSELAHTMLARTLGILRQSSGIDGVVVVSRDRDALQIAQGYGATALVEQDAGLNPALEQAARYAVTLGARATLVLPIDLPKFSALDITQLSLLARPAPCVVVAPATRDGGTNALLLNPVGLIAYGFGPRSSARHRRRAREAGVLIKLYQSEPVGFDVDLPIDLQQLAD